MSELDRNLLPDEKVIFRTKKHLIIFFWPVVWTIFSLFATQYMLDSQILAKVAWVPWIIALLFWLYVYIEYSFSEFAVTNKRVMMREGFFNKHTNELRVATVSQVNINQGIFGQLLNFGTVWINAFGAQDAYTLIAKPNDFQRAVNLEIDKNTS